MGIRLTVPNRRFRICKLISFRMYKLISFRMYKLISFRMYKLISFRMYKFLNLLWGPRFGGQTGCRRTSPPRTQPQPPRHVLTLSDRSRDPVALSFASNIVFVPSLEHLWRRLRCRIEVSRWGKGVVHGTGRDERGPGTRMYLGPHNCRLQSSPKLHE